MKTDAKKKTLFPIWIIIIILIVIVVANAQKGKEPTATVKPIATVRAAATATKQPVDLINKANTPTATPKTIIEQTMTSSYVKDPIINRFITEFNDVSPEPLTNIKNGNIRTKFYGYAFGIGMEMINANDAVAEAFCLSIPGGQTEDGKQAMFELFRISAKILDLKITDEMLDKAIREFETRNVMIENYELASLNITYIPLKKLSYGMSNCRIDINASNYK